MHRNRNMPIRVSATNLLSDLFESIPKQATLTNLKLKNCIFRQRSFDIFYIYLNILLNQKLLLNPKKQTASPVLE